MDILTRLTAALADRYRIERELGQGGMATVFLAEDVKHKRKVALKVLKPELAAVLGAERFVQEITTTAALQHPHILPLFDSGTADGFLYYVMPFIDGETLRAKLNRETQLGVEEAVRIAREVADALDYAHSHGVIHRDIKPENILLANGRPMVADFGIALAVSAAAGGRMTETGLSLGTPHYMSPEQATAEKEITGRSDVYSLASVLYEMLTGEPPHMGNSAQQIIMKIITETAQPVTRLRKSVPQNVADSVAKALEKLPADRFASAAAFSAALADPNATNLRSTTRPAVAATRRQWLLSGILAAASLLAGLAIGTRDGWNGKTRSDQVARVSISLGDSVVVRAIGNLRLALSPAGDRIAFVGADGADDALWVRELSQSAARKLPDTKGAFAPFFSPDGSSVGFFTAIQGALKMKVISLTGSVVRTVLSDSIAPFGGADWADDGQIYFTNASRGLSRIAATGGPVTAISHRDQAKGQQEHDYPDVLPGNKLAMVTMWTGSAGSNRIGVVDLATGAITDIGAGNFVRYVEPGYLAIGTANGQVLLASFDAKKGQMKSSPVLILEGVQVESTNGTLQFAVSTSGALLFQATTNDRTNLSWVSRNGVRAPVDSAREHNIPTIALSPDGRSIAMGIEDQIWVKQLATGALTRLSFGVEAADRPVWSTDGRSVLFMAQRDGKRLAWMRRADGSDTTHAAVPGQTPLDEIGVDPRGRYTLLRTEGSSGGTRKLLILENGVDTAPRLLIPSTFDHYGMTLSPDGRWLALVSTESGTPEVHVRPFPDVGSSRFVVSVGGGMEPVWRRDGKELFFRNLRGDMYAASVTTGATFTHGSPTRLFAGTGLAIQQYYRGYDVHPDGKRFLMVSAGGADAGRLEMIINWRHELLQLEKSPP